MRLMLFLSRWTSHDTFGVVDTDDGVEVIVTWDDIKSLVSSGKIVIRGIDTVSNATYFRTYQPYDTISAKQSKLYALYGVDIKVWQSWISSVVITGSSRQCRVRLSEFGRRLSALILKDCDDNHANVVLVLDDKVKVGTQSLRQFFKYCVLDITEVTNNRIYERVYKEMTLRYPDWDAFIIDRPERMDYFKALAVLERPVNDNPHFNHISAYVSTAEATSARIAQEYMSEFERLVNMEFRLLNGYFPSDRITTEYVVWLCQPHAKNLLKQGYYDCIRLSQYNRIFFVLKHVVVYDEQALIRFENFIKLFDAPVEVQDLFIRFCKRTTEWLMQQAGVVGQSRG